ncbi:MAG: tRNA lysidine(34) synthetase TilS [Muribaculaceae bacterium]|nr:tRNA lysidine(34) synthetase TilS [Muribaculaceae bacterium]
MSARRNKIEQSCRRHLGSGKTGKVVLALSGGADSTALFRALLGADIEFEAAHCNFNLRGEESLRDRDFVADLCARHCVTLHLAEFDTRAVMQKGESVEMACRRLRYDFFRQLMAESGFTGLVVAHNADDNAETFFLNMLRGSGTTGLRGMQEVSGNIYRPLLPFSRQEILEYLASLGQDYITDSSNLSSDFRRNFLRNEVFPLLRSRWPGFDQAMARTIEHIGSENKIVEEAVAKSLPEDGRFLPLTAIENFADPKTLIYRFISPLGGNFTMAGEILESLRNGTPGKVWQLFESETAITTQAGLRIVAKEEDGLPKPDDFIWEKFEGKDIKWEEVFNASSSEIWVAETPDRFKWVYPTPDSYLRSLGMKGRQNVWKILKDNGVPHVLRARYPLLADVETEEIIWVPGMKRSRSLLLSGSEPTLYRLRMLLPGC